MKMGFRQIKKATKVKYQETFGLALEDYKTNLLTLGQQQLHCCLPNTYINLQADDRRIRQQLQLQSS